MAQRRDCDVVLRSRFETVAKGLDRQILTEIQRIENGYRQGALTREAADREVDQLVAKADLARRNAAQLIRQQIQEQSAQFLDKLDKERGRSARLRRLEMEYNALSDDELGTIAKAFIDGDRSLDPDEVALLSGSLREVDPDLHRDFRTIARETGVVDHWRSDPELTALDAQAQELETTPSGYVRLTGPDGSVDAPLRSLVDWDDALGKEV